MRIQKFRMANVNLVGFFKLFICLSIALSSCKRNEAVVNVENKNLENFFFDSKLSNNKYNNDVVYLKEYFSKNDYAFQKIKGQPLWSFMTSWKSEKISILPIEVSDLIAGFVLIDRTNENKVLVEYNVFGRDFRKGDRSMTSLESFLINLILNEKIKGKATYEFGSVYTMPYLFKKLTKLENYLLLNTNLSNRVKITIRTTQSTSKTSSTIMPCEEVCAFVELPNFNFQDVCWNTCGIDNYSDWWANSSSYIDPYLENSGNGGGSSSSTTLDAAAAFVSSTLGISEELQNVIYTLDPRTFLELYYCLQNSTSPNKVNLANEHLAKLDFMNLWVYPFYDYSYYDYLCTKRIQTSNNFLWWDDYNWMLNGGDNLLNPAQVLSVDKSNIINPNLKVVLDRFTINTYKSFILKSYFNDDLNNPFTRKQYELKFTEVYSLTDANGLQIPAKIIPTNLGNNKWKLEIQLNLPMFFNKSQEWVSAVILHELVHGLLIVTNHPASTQDAQHDWMFANGSPVAIKDALRELFPLSQYPNFSDANAISLGLDGLQNAYMMPDPNNPSNNIINPAKDQVCITKYNISLAIAISNFLAYRTLNALGILIAGTPF